MRIMARYASLCSTVIFMTMLLTAFLPRCLAAGGQGGGEEVPADGDGEFLTYHVTKYVS